MRKLTYEQVRDNINNHLKLNGFQEQPEEGNRFECMVQGFLDAINECIEETETDYTGKYIQFKEDCVFDTMQIPKDQLGMCMSDNGDSLDIHSCGYSHTVPKVSVYLCEEE